MSDKLRLGGINMSTKYKYLNLFGLSYYASRVEGQILSAKHVEAVLKTLYESAPMVYGFANKHGWYRPDTESNQYATHEARLFFIEEFKPKECVHEPDSYYSLNESLICKHCEVVIKPTRWELA